MGETEAGDCGADRQEPTSESPAEESVLWSPEVEVCLFHAMLGHKPVGVNRHFHMICIRDKFSQNIGRQISSKVIWDHLRSMYDMQALHESEILPFPNSEKNFILPEDIIQEVKEGKVMSEEEIKEEVKDEVDAHPGPDEASFKMQFDYELVVTETYGLTTSDRDHWMLWDIIGITQILTPRQQLPGRSRFGPSPGSLNSLNTDMFHDRRPFVNSSGNSSKSADKPSVKEKERTLSESGTKESGDKRKRSRLTEKVLNANSNPSSPNANKRRRT